MSPVGTPEIVKALKGMEGLFIHEFTFYGLRIDAVVLNLRERKVRGFEIKVSREDFLQDKKWQLYSQFCSELSIVCPSELIQVDEVKSPFGLLWIGPAGEYIWKKRPKNIQHRDALAWTWRYLEILETEFPRLLGELARHEVFVKSRLCSECGKDAIRTETTP